MGEKFSYILMSLPSSIIIFILSFIFIIIGIIVVLSKNNKENVNEIDSNTFEYLGGDYAKDKKNIYYYMRYNGG